MIGKSMVKIIVPTMVLPVILYQSAVKSDSRPPVRPNEKNYSLMSALTSKSRIAVLKNYTANVTFVVSFNCSVSVGYPIQATSLMQIVRRTKFTIVMKYLRRLISKKVVERMLEYSPQIALF